MTETKWTTCEVCGCKYRQAIMPGGKLSGDTACPAIKLPKNALNAAGEMWRERMLKHRPDWDTD